MKAYRLLLMIRSKASLTCGIISLLAISPAWMTSLFNKKELSMPKNSFWSRNRPNTLLSLEDSKKNHNSANRTSWKNLLKSASNKAESSSRKTGNSPKSWTLNSPKAINCDLATHLGSRAAAVLRPKSRSPPMRRSKRKSLKLILSSRTTDRENERIHCREINFSYSFMIILISLIYLIHRIHFSS